MKIFQKKFILIAGSIALVVCTTSFAIYFYLHAKQLENRPEAEKQKEQIQQMVQEISQFAELPLGEQPTMVTVSDPEKLKAQAFFASAASGDKVLLYQSAKKAILYRPSTRKIIEMSTISTPESTPSVGEVKKEIRVFLLNGTTVSGLTKKYETTLKSSVPEAVVVDRDTAKKTDYKKSVLIDMTGLKEEEAQSLAKTLDLDVVPFSKEESIPSGADFLIILGSDQT